MAVATLTVEARPALGPVGRVMALDCRHGTTHLWIGGDPGGPEISNAAAGRLMLLKHLEEQPRCRCIRELWRAHFGMPYPHVPSFVELPGLN